MLKGRFSKKALALILAGALLAVGIGSGTLAWLSDKTAPVENKFSPSDITVELSETTREFQMVPGWTIDKDPLVTVKAGSEDSWVFLEVQEEGSVSYTPEGDEMPVVSTFRDFIRYEIDSHNWTQLSDETGNPVQGVYYCYANEISDSQDRVIKVLDGGKYEFNEVTYTWKPNQVLTRPEVTKEMMNAVNEDNQPTLSFTAYAVQYWKNNTTRFEPYEAWKIAKGVQ